MYMCVYGGECICCLRCVGTKNESERDLPDGEFDDIYPYDGYADDADTSFTFVLCGDKANNDSVSETYETDHPKCGIEI